MFSPAEIAISYITVAKNKTSMKWYKAVLSAVLAGAFIALGGAVATAASSGFSGGAAALIKGAVFPVGLILVVICGAELFTGNCLLISPCVGKDIKVTSMLKSWGLVYLGNFIGGALIAILVVYSGVIPNSSLAAVTNAKVNVSGTGFLQSFLRGILCNMLVCLAVWGSMASKSAAGKILALYFPILTFVACGFEHSVANMYYLTAALLAGSECGLGNALLYCLIPSTLGNIIGGGAIALIYHFIYRFKSFTKKTAEKSDTVTEEKNDRDEEQK